MSETQMFGFVNTAEAEVIKAEQPQEQQADDTEKEN